MEDLGQAGGIRLKTFIKAIFAICICGGAVAIPLPWILPIFAPTEIEWRIVKPQKGDVVQYVRSSGTIKPVKSVQVGSSVSGPIAKLYAEFNQEVKANELLAKIDARLVQANVQRDKAALEISKAEVNRVEAQLQQAVNNEKRAMALFNRNKKFIAQSELDRVKFATLSLKSQLVSAKASVEQAEASLSNTMQNLEFTNIRSPEDGIIIDRKVEPGQTLAAQFTTPELFVVGVGMRKKMHVFASIDESEIGLIRDAAKNNQPVLFKVDAYPQDLFEGSIEEVRFSSTTTQNVVTYPVVVAAKNPDLKLLPGMTANLAFQIKSAKNVMKIPKSALRFFPEDSSQVHPEDHHYLTEETDRSGKKPQKNVFESSQKVRDRIIWRLDNKLLRAVKVTTGVSDATHVSVNSEDLSENTQIITGELDNEG